MPIDSSVLLQATQPQMPYPVALAGQALTLGNLSGQNQIMQYNLQAAQDLPGAMQLISQYKNPSDAMPAIMQQYPRAAAQAAQLIKQWELTQAQTTATDKKSAAYLCNPKGPIRAVAPKTETFSIWECFLAGVGVRFL